jgi:signal transduction protein with GAF and PtsI domain
MLQEAEREPLSVEAEVMIEKFETEFYSLFGPYLLSAPKAHTRALSRLLNDKDFQEGVKEAIRKGYRCGRAHERHETEKSADKKVIELLDDYNHERNRLWEDLRQKVKKHG